MLQAGKPRWLPVTEPSRPPFLAALRWGQVLFGAFLGMFLLNTYRAWPLETPDLIARSVLLLVSLTVFAVVLQNQYRFGLVPDYSLKCRFCNGPVNRYSEFCEHCGADLIADEKLVKCPKCQTEVYEGTKHCPECGASVGAGKKGKKAKKQAPEPETASVGWSTPVDAVTGFPPDDERR
jgi:hypothetical protein